MTLLRLRPYRLLKATGTLRAQAIPLAEGTYHQVPRGNEQFAVSSLLRGTDAQLCLVEVLGPNGERPARYVPEGTRAERLAAAGIEVERSAKSPWDMTREDAIEAGRLGPIDGPDGAA